MLMFESDINKRFCKGNTFSLTPRKSVQGLLQMMNVQFSKDLFHFCIKIPGRKLIHFNNGIRQFAFIPFFTDSFIILNCIDDGMIMMKNIFKNCLILEKNRILFKQSDRYIFMNP